MNGVKVVSMSAAVPVDGRTVEDLTPHIASQQPHYEVTLTLRCDSIESLNLVHEIFFGKKLPQ